MLRFFFSFEGRLDRVRAWLLLLQLAVLAALIIAAGRCVLWVGDGLGTPLAITWTSTVNSLLITLSAAAYYLSLLSLSVRRLHDRNKSGVWIVWAMALVLFCCGGIAWLERSDFGPYQAGAHVGAVALFVLAAGIILRFYIEILGLQGTVGDNRYGADPLGFDRLQPKA